MRHASLRIVNLTFAALFGPFAPDGSRNVSV